MESIEKQTDLNNKEKAMPKEKKGELGRPKGDTGSKVFCCEQCGKVAKTRQALERHAAYHNSDRPFECKMCGQCFKNSDDLGKHLRRLRKDGKMEHACRVCHKHFKSDVLLQKHIEMLGCEKQGSSGIVHDPGQTVAVRDTGDKEHAEVSSSNMEASEGDLKCFCKDCELEFPSTFALKSHYKEMHEDRRRQVCLKCGQTLSSKDSLMRHYNIFHQSDFPYHCEYCQQKFKVKESLFRHIKFVHKDGGYKCDICERIFSQPVNLKKHMAVHSTLKEYSCETCGKEFRWKQSLQKHVLLHASPDDAGRKQGKRQGRVLKTGNIDSYTGASYSQSEIQGVDDTSERNHDIVEVKEIRDEVIRDAVNEAKFGREFENKLTSEVREIDCDTEEFQRLVETFSEETLDNTDVSGFSLKDKTREYKAPLRQGRVTEDDTGFKRKSEPSREITDDLTQSKKFRKSNDNINEGIQPVREYTEPRTHGQVVRENSFVSDYGQNEVDKEGNKYSGHKDVPEDLADSASLREGTLARMKRAEYSPVVGSSERPWIELDIDVVEDSTGSSSSEVQSTQDKESALKPTVSESSAPIIADNPKDIPAKRDERPSSAKVMFRPSSISSIFAPESSSSSADSPLSDSRETSLRSLDCQAKANQQISKKIHSLHEHSRQYQETSSPSTDVNVTEGRDLNDLDRNINNSSNDLNTENSMAVKRLPLKYRLNRSTSSPSPSGFGKFSLIKHMLSLQSEEHFDKSLFVNPFYSRPGNLKSLHKLTDKHKFSNGVDEFNCSSKHNIPFQWLGLSVRKDQERAESEEMGEMERNEGSPLRQETRYTESAVTSEQDITGEFNENSPAHSNENINETYIKNVARLIPENSEPVFERDRIPVNSEPVYQTDRIPVNSEPVYQTDRIPVNSEPVYESDRIPVNSEPVYLRDRYMDHTTNSFSESGNLDVLDLTKDFPCHERRASEGDVEQSIVGSYKRSISQTLPAASESEAINLSTKHSATNHMAPIEQFHLSLSSAKKFNGFEAMKRLVKHSQNKADESYQQTFSSLTSPFDTYGKRTEPVRLCSSPKVNTANSVDYGKRTAPESLCSSAHEQMSKDFQAPFFQQVATANSVGPHAQTSVSKARYHSSNNLLNSSYPPPSSSSSMGHSSSSTASSSSSLQSFSAYSGQRTTNTPEILSSVPGCNNPVSPFTALVSVASSLHQSKYQKIYQSAQGTSQILHMSASYPRMSQNSVTNANQFSVHKSRHEVDSGQIMVNEGRVGPIFPTKQASDMSILDILKAPDYTCVGF